MPSSFKSSSMVAPFKMTPDDGSQLRHGHVQVVVDHGILILTHSFQFAAGTLQTALDRFLAVGAARPQTLFVGFQRRCSQKNRHCILATLSDLGRALHVNVEDYAHAFFPVRLDLA